MTLPTIEKVPMCHPTHPEPPEGPPCRKFKLTLFCGLIETKESKQKTRDWENYMRGYNACLINRKVTPIKKRPPIAEHMERY